MNNNFFKVARWNRTTCHNFCRVAGLLNQLGSCDICCLRHSVIKPSVRIELTTSDLPSQRSDLLSYEDLLVGDRRESNPLIFPSQGNAAPFGFDHSERNGSRTRNLLRDKQASYHLLLTSVITFFNILGRNRTHVDLLRR